MRKKFVEGPLGFRTTEAMARRLDAAIKSVPKTKDYQPRRKFTSGEVDLQSNERTEVSLVSTPAVDRDGESILSAGVELEEFRLNPVVLHQHNQDLPIGKCLWIKADESGLKAKTYYPPRPKNFEGEWLADQIWGLVQAEVLKGKSVGIFPLQLRDPTPEEQAVDERLHTVISRSLLFEYSVVAVPSCPEALVQAVSKGISLGPLGWKVIGKVPEKKSPRVIRPTREELLSEALKRVRFDPAEIARKAIRNLESAWDI